MSEPTLIERLNDEADLCRNDHADDIAVLLDEAAKALSEAEQLHAGALAVKLGEQQIRITDLTLVAVRAYQFRHTVLMTPERYAAQDLLDAALAEAGFDKAAIGKEIDRQREIEEASRAHMQQGTNVTRRRLLAALGMEHDEASEPGSFKDAAGILAEKPDSPNVQTDSLLEAFGASEIEELWE